MTRIPLLHPESTDTSRQPQLQQVQKAFGTVPNMFRAVAHSPAALAMMWSAFGALGKGQLGAALGEQIAVAVANRNGCDYCLAAHTVLGQAAGVPAAQLADAQVGHAADPRTQAALDFALALVSGRGQVDAAHFGKLRAQGFDDGAIVEILAHVALNLFTNYTNIAFDVPVDFPAVPLRQAA